LEVRRGGQIKEGTEVVGNDTKIKVVKNKVAPPFKVAEVEIMYGEGISRTGEVISMAVDKDIINKSGAWYGYNDDRIGQGKEKTKQYLKENPALFEEIYQKVRTAYGISGSIAEETALLELEEVVVGEVE